MHKHPYPSSASLASLDSGKTLILIKSAPQPLYMMLSARVENWGPSIQIMVLSVWSFTPLPSSSNTCLTRLSNQATSLVLKGSPNVAWATMLVPSKKLTGRTPFVRSITWDGRMKSPGAISSRSEPTAEKARIAFTPRDLRAEIFARDGTLVGEMVWPLPWRARKAIFVPDGKEQMVIGELGKPQG